MLLPFVGFAHCLQFGGFYIRDGEKEKIEELHSQREIFVHFRKVAKEFSFYKFIMRGSLNDRKEAVQIELLLNAEYWAFSI